MEHWRATSPSPLNIQQLYNHSQEALGVDDIGGSDLPPQSPVFDFEDFLTDPATTHHMASSSHLSPMGDLDNPHSWANWDSPSQLHQEHSINPFSSFSHSIVPQGSPALNPYRSSPLHQAKPYKPHEVANASAQSTMSTIYAPQQQQQQQMGSFTLTQPISYLPSSASFSDYELALSATTIPRDNDVDMYHAGKLDIQQLSPHYHAFGKMPYGDSVYGNGHSNHYPAYGRDSISHSLLPATRVDQQRQYIPRRDSSVPPYATEYLPARSNANVIFAASAPNPSTFSNTGSFSPSSSPRSIDGGSVARSSPSLPPASPQLFTPSSPGEQFAAPPSQFSASPHQFMSLSPTFTSATPITFVNQTNHYSTNAHSDDARLSSSQESTAPEDSRMRKRRRVLLTDAEDDSDEKRSDGMFMIFLIVSISQEPFFGFCSFPD